MNLITDSLPGNLRWKLLVTRERLAVKHVSALMEWSGGMELGIKKFSQEVYIFFLECLFSNSISTNHTLDLTALGMKFGLFYNHTFCSPISFLTFLSYLRLPPAK